MSNMPNLMRLSLADLRLLMDMKEAEEQKALRRRQGTKRQRRLPGRQRRRWPRPRPGGRKVTAAKKQKAMEVESGSEVSPGLHRRRGRAR
jgi:hypothetical protein